MIENTILQINKHLPLLITDITWYDGRFCIRGVNWIFNITGSWRLSTKSNVVFGCYDGDIYNSINVLINLKIINVGIQDNVFKTDLVFILENGNRLEFFSIKKDDPWHFYIENVDLFLPN
jgi:hypothetical protein